MRLFIALLTIIATFVTTLSVTTPSSAEASNQVVIEGTIDKMVPSKKEIYVLAEGKKHEFYFKENTTVAMNGKEATYDNLSKGLKVKVTANKVGKRLDPISVEVLP